MLLGDEAISQAAIDAGISGIYAYPGTPSTEITEYVYKSKEAKDKGIIASWTSNEKTSVESALGMSYAGKRAMACMKHVGLNVAADPFINSAITGVNGGLLVVSADDPSMHSSQNEQDSRFYGKFALVPVLEPSTHQETYDMVFYGYELSEKYKIPVLIRLTTRLAHSRSVVIRKKEKYSQKYLKLDENTNRFILLPFIARKQYEQLLAKQLNFEQESEISPYNTFYDAPDKSLGIIACGTAYNYLMENFENAKSVYPVLKICQYPLPKNKILKLANQTEKILIIEEGYPFVEEQLRGLLYAGNNILGRLDGTIPRQGELNPNIIAEILGNKTTSVYSVPKILVSRPPSLCSGCPHIDSFIALNEALKPYSRGRVFSDIGCYTLGAFPPFESINTCVDMGASITMAKGASDAGLIPAVAVIGDSTFTHSGITGLLDAVVSKSAITVIILDNYTTAMTGGQPSHAYKRIAEICKGLGVEEEHLHIIEPLSKHHSKNTEIIKKELEYSGVSVIVPTRECIQTLIRKKTQ